MLQPSFKEIIRRLDSGQLFQFPGGVHPDGRKLLSSQTAVATLPLPDKLVIPVRQHIGIEGSLLVQVGDKVLKGQPLTQSGQHYSVPVHAPTSGEVTRVADHVTAHPSGLTELCIEITPDGKEKWTTVSPVENYQSVAPSVLLSRICDAGISGMGGAGFPSHIKASASKPVEFLVVNGVECEPYITSDDRLMREHAGQIIEGVDILRHLLSPLCVIIAIEDNKPEALSVFQKIAKVREDIKVIAVKTKYPAGGEKQLIEVLTGREVPGNGLPIDVGVTMFNVGTCFAIADAVIRGKPLLQRIVTVTGEAIERPGNYWTLLGTPINHLLKHTGYLADKQVTPQVIMGGPMMGFTLNDAAVPVVKTTNCLLVPATGELTQGDNERACIRCSACADACPASLLPQQLFWHSKAKEYDKAQDYHLFDCIECGACAYVCPSEIPLVHYYRRAKSDIRLQRDEKNKAEKAKERFEARKARLEREKREREEKHLKAKAAREASAAPKTSASTATPSSKDKVAAALARAKARKAAQAQPGEKQVVSATDAGTTPTDKKAAVAAAVARAKAKKAQQAAKDASQRPTQDNADGSVELTT
ncbi:electron transport complex subunit RsxC, partial [Aestuariibacter sp. A3R04]|uniref:electron transport complex subunit RsxC n=1 Tax=Aestuariibacter sp. A3R04 TaxID=2841571 RepID=UPI00352EC3A7